MFNTSITGGGVYTLYLGLTVTFKHTVKIKKLIFSFCLVDAGVVYATSKY
jgi:hypothetical protein